MGLLLKIFMSNGQPMGELVIPDEDDVEALGRMIASENNTSRDTLLIKQAIAWAAVNMARRDGKSVASLVMPGGVPGHQAGRYASTANPSTTETRSIAFDILSGKVPDPTKGAIQFDAPRTQDALYAQGKVRLDSEGVAANRESEGKEAVYLPGVDPRYMRWWRYA
jgi:hypothetical protein